MDSNDYTAFKRGVYDEGLIKIAHPSVQSKGAILPLSSGAALILAAREGPQITSRIQEKGIRGETGGLSYLILSRLLVAMPLFNRLHLIF